MGYVLVITPAAGAFAAILAAMLVFIAASTVQSGLILRRWLPPGNLLLSWPDNLLRLVVVIVCLALGLTVGPGPAALAWRPAATPGILITGLVGGALLTVSLTLAGIWAVGHWGEAVYSNRMVQCILPANRAEWAGVVPALFLAAALEELLFRWLPLAGLAGLISPWWLLWPLSLFFGLLHFPQGWWGVAGTLLAGIFLSLLFLATGSIWPPLIAHYLMNVAQLVIAVATGVKPLRGRA